MNNIARKLVLSALTVVLTVVALGTTTFAWFTLTNTAVVQPFQASIVADTGIEVSLDGVDWYTTLTEATVENYITTTYGSFAFTHLTTSTGFSNFNTLGATGLEAAASGWLQIPIYFRSNSATAIDWTAVTLTSPVAAWQTDVAFNSTTGAVTAGSFIDIDAANAMRISVQGTVASATKVVVYEKATGVNQNVVLGGDGLTPVDYSNSGTGVAGSYNYYQVKTGALIPGTDAVVVAPTVTAVNATTGIQRVTDLNADTTYGTAYWGQIMIRIWVEGWDADAYNSILAREITAGFTFVGA
ncbi:MAG: hypothetical protein CVV58_03975 [Tenericutes bacterium HGW-Tenericutes-3]|nr:MAG: hypothetical protein CVV58_03975 [Tenericutes bacterium HGW-Tenericutes-3]